MIDRIVSSVLLAAALLVAGDAPAHAASKLAMQSHEFCVEDAVIELSEEVCPEPDVTFTVCLTASPAEYYWTHRVGGIGVVVWDVKGTAAITSGDGDQVAFQVAGSYTWGIRSAPDGIEWSVVADDPSRYLTGVSDEHGSFGMRITGGSGEVVDGIFSLNGDMSFEIADVGAYGTADNKGHEGIGAVSSRPAVVEGKVTANARADSDLDGIADADDNAILIANANQSDADGDGIGDVIDVCPNDGEDLCFDADEAPDQVPNHLPGGGEQPTSPTGTLGR